MLTITDLKRLLTLENELVMRQTRGLSHADALIQPQPSGNCMNWVLGHTLESQMVLLETLGGVSPLDRAELARYTRESEPIVQDGPDVLPLERLLAGHEQVHRAVLARLAEMNEADFEVEIPFGERMARRGWRVFFLHFHYTYHLGQLELLRQLAGKSEKLI